MYAHNTCFRREKKNIFLIPRIIHSYGKSNGRVAFFRTNMVTSLSIDYLG